MTGILVATAIIVGFALCLVFADPWQRPRYRRVYRAARRRVAEIRVEPLDEFDAMVAAELHREANGQ